jgi:nucleoside-diphosphate-sugar epimerase
MRTVVVTGCAGVLGVRVGEALRSQGMVVRGVDLPAVARTSGTEVIGLDLASADDDALAELLAGADTVVHLAWQIPEGRGSVRPRHPANDANRRALDGVLRAAATQHVTQIVFVSSATVYGAWPDNPVPLSEDARLRPNPSFAYGMGKAEAERAVAEWHHDHESVTLTVLRPTVTVGGLDHPLYRALGAIRSPRGVEGNRPVQYLHVDDLAAAVVLAVTQRLDGVFNVAPDAGVREDVARELAGGLAKVALPSRLAGAVAIWSWDLWRTGIPKEALPYSIHPWVIAADRIRARGWQPRYSSEEALVATDLRPHWDDLPPGRRQNYTMILLAGGVTAVLGSLTAAVLGWRRRR